MINIGMFACLLFCLSLSQWRAIKRIKLFTNSIFRIEVCACVLNGSFLNGSLAWFSVLSCISQFCIISHDQWAIFSKYIEMCAQGAESLVMHLNIGIGILWLCLHSLLFGVFASSSQPISIKHQICSGVSCIWLNWMHDCTFFLGIKCRKYDRRWSSWLGTYPWMC